MRNHSIAIMQAFRQTGARLRGDRRGVSAVEFALILPVMISLYLGLTEVSQGIGIKRKVTLTAHALSDLASNPAAGRTITEAEVASVLTAATAVIAPYPAAPLTVTVTAVNIDKNGKATVGWSRGGAQHSPGGGVTIPSALAVPNSQLIMSEVSYAYTPAIGHAITGTLTLSDKLYMAPRRGDAITLQAS
ncbi:MAG TPA: TadE/TadG family type IV pilus assembly protein [Pseudolabrys sp.]|nr:TadE/TadG family type IV pilus assembly protein [Pseudolabrys sp.]